MSLRKSPTLTAALLAANRRNAQKSTGPRTARGKANVRMNALRERGRSRLWRDFVAATINAPPGGVERVVRDLLTPDLARQHLFALHAQIAIEADMPETDRLRRIRALLRRKPKKGIPYFCEQSGNVLENKASPKTNSVMSVDVLENTILI